MAKKEKTPKDHQESNRKSSRTSSRRPGDAVSWRQRHPRRQQTVALLRPSSRRDDPGDEGAKLSKEPPHIRTAAREHACIEQLHIYFGG
ncbi:hypothetical protein F441_22855 [Phytophthora nicotianae CJ01A1]|uniref:Uncharacterized protein n=1 Tax=Phytophthora nicotianae CJ01A1 TaxID=1317063 RepID=W2VNH6_PHYNI|nr:hypothetical protein F441_22855 [Phytophthora nicotianae CJ01A1]